MITYYDNDRAEPKARLFPYVAREPAHNDYTDFTKNPELIETNLEDFIPHSKKPAVQSFYDFLRWINGSESHLLTCDCALRAPEEHSDSNSDHKLCIHGRLFILFRHLPYNTQIEQSDWLCGRMMHELNSIDVEFPASRGVVGFTKQPALHTDLSKGEWKTNGYFESYENDPGEGHHLMLSFWGYGETEEDAFESLKRVFTNIWEATRSISKYVDEADQGASHNGDKSPHES